MVIKPLEKWTLKEVKEYCQARPLCDDCIIAKHHYCLTEGMGLPCDWPDHVTTELDTTIPEEK